jgi:hypothetical protein
MPPWEVTGEKLTRWGRMVWRYRMELYANEQNSKQQREIEDMRNR